jgi:hypothetical protein
LEVDRECANAVNQNVTWEDGDMRREVLVAASLLLTAVPLAQSAEPVTKGNWSRHPAILEIKAIYGQVRQAEAAGRLRQLRRQFPDCYDEVRELNQEPGGRVRSYHFSGGSEDSAAQYAYYYDQHGRLRFVLMKAGAVNGTWLEHRIYLSKDGTRLWEVEKRGGGPGYTFPDVRLVNDPEQDFRSGSRCSEP